MGAQLAALKKKVAKMDREDSPEVKAFYVNANNVTNTSYSSSVPLIQLTTIPQGDAQSSRVGAKCRARQMRIRWSIFGQDAVGGHGSVLLRLLVVQYDDPSSTATRYASEFLANTGNAYTLTAPPAYYNPFNFKVLVDEVVNVASDYFGDTDSQAFIERVIPLNKVLVYDSNSTIVPSEGAIAMAVISDDSTLGVANVSYTYSSELMFTDA